MNEQQEPYYNQRQPYDGTGMWRPPVPTPYVTHQDMAPVHSRLGSLEQGHTTLLQTYNHLRGDMITHFDKIEKLIEAQKPADTGGVTLTTREMVAVVIALILAGAILSRLPGVEHLLG